MKRFYTISEVCEMTSLSRSTIERRMFSGTIPYHKVGSRVLIPARAIDKLVGSPVNEAVLS